jgi:hypothetical protein
MVYYIDIDNTICQTIGSNYEQSIPIKQRILKINNLYKQGHTVVYWTARGSNSGKDWKTFTERQLDNWGCLRHNILMNKPSYDILIDDKSINSEDYFYD